MEWALAGGEAHPTGPTDNPRYQVKLGKLNITRAADKGTVAVDENSVVQAGIDAGGLQECMEAFIAAARRRICRVLRGRGRRVDWRAVQVPKCRREDLNAHHYMGS